MFVHGETAPNSVRGALDQRIDALMSGFKTMIDRIPKPNSEPSRLRAAVAKTGETIAAHPVAALAVAVGLGYVIVRLVRR
jgi:ElaB/YqjD/DUF883 family membrane-anchored ribosome-binding protein